MRKIKIILAISFLSVKLFAGQNVKTLNLSIPKNLSLTLERIRSTGPKSSAKDISTRITNVVVPHISLSINTTFDKFTHNLEKFAGKFDRAVLKANLSKPTQLRQKLQAMQGEQQLMIFSVEDHGSLLILYGQARHAKQYLVGNPLIASSMTHYDIRAALYAPLRMLVYEDDHNRVHIEYDLPSAQFGQFKNKFVTATGKDLDVKMMKLIQKCDQ